MKKKQQMFYELENLDSQLKCPVCDQKYISPRILPCGKSVCHECIRQLTTNDQRGFVQNTSFLSCPMCHTEHTIPNEGFIINEFIVNTLQLKPKKVFRCASFETLDRLLDKLKCDLNDVRDKLDRPADKIADYCAMLRNRIDLRTELLIEKLNVAREHMLDEVNKYEQTLVRNINNVPPSDLSSLETRLNAIGNKLDEHERYLNQARIDENVVRRMIGEARSAEFNLKNFSTILDRKLFGADDYVLKFNDAKPPADETSTMLGTLDREKSSLDPTSGSQNLIYMENCLVKKLDFNKSSSGLEIDKIFELNGKYVILSENRLKIYDDDASFVPSAEITFDQNPECLLTNNAAHLILVQHRRFIWKNNKKQTNSFSSLTTYDLDLNLKYEIVVEFAILSCCATSHNVFVQQQQLQRDATTDDAMAITVFNWSLEKITSLGQLGFCDGPYYFKGTILCFVRDDKIYLKKQTSASASNVCSSQERSFVRVVSLTSGALIGQYLVDLRDVELLNVDSHGRTILADTKACKLRIYDKPTKRRVGVMEKLELVYENELEALRDATYLSFTRDDKLCLVKNKSSILYYSIYSAI